MLCSINSHLWSCEPPNSWEIQRRSLPCQPGFQQHRYCQTQGAQPLQLCQKAQVWSQSSLPTPATAAGHKECVSSHVLFGMGNAFLDWTFWFVSTHVWFTSQSGLGAHDQGSFHVNPSWNMMQKNCRNTANMLPKVMDQTVYGMWLKLAWSKCPEISPKERSLAFTVSLYRPAAVRSHCFLRKHGQRLQTLCLYHKTPLLDDGVTLGNGLITRQFSPCTEKRIPPLSSQNTDAII